MNSAEVLIKFKGDTDDVEKKTESLSGKIQGLTKSIALGNIAAKGITKAFQVMSENMDGAISRVDRMNNFSTVMSNLGVSAEDSNQVIQDLSDKLVGLPTTLDSASSSVQRFTAYNGDIKKSRDYFLAVNNAILAGTNDTNMQAAAMEQLTQAYTKGKPEMQDWKTLLQAMPAQLKQVSLAMGYVSTDELYKALQSGEINMNDFMDTMVKLNETGVGEFASLNEQARANTNGIKTSVVNMKTAITRGVASLITSSDSMLSSFGGLSGLIENFGKNFENVLKSIGKVMSGEISVKDLAAKGMEILTNFSNTIIENLPTIIETGMKVMSDFVIGFTQGLPSLIPKIIDIILTIVENLINNIDLLIDASIELIIGLAEGLIQAIPILIEKIPIIIEKLVTKLTDPEMLGKIIQAAAKLITELAIGLVMAIPELVKGVMKISESIIGGLKNLSQAMLEIGLNITRGIWSGISNSLQWLKNKITGWVGNVMKFIKGLFGIHSPSKVMEEQVGQWLPKGIAVGITANTDSVNNAMDDLQSDILTNYGVSPQVANSSALHYSPNIVNNNIINVETDPLGQVVNNIKTFSGGAKNDYNWGAAL